MYTPSLSSSAGISALLLTCALSLHATDYTWDGGVGNWTDANWNGGNIALESDGMPPSASSYDYVGDNIFINGGSVTSGQRVTLQGGGLSVNTASLSLSGTANNSAFNIGFGGGPTTVSLVDAALSLTGAGNAGRTMRLQNGSSMVVDNSVVDILSSGANAFLEIEAGTSVSMINGSTLNLGVLRLDGTVANNTMFTFESGSITLDGYNNALRSSAAFSGAFNWTGVAGAGSLTQVDNSVAGRALAFKVSQGFFAIDGTRIDPLVDPTVSSLADLNDELATLTVNDKYFQITEMGGAQTLGIVAVPEPSTWALGLLAALGLLCWRRRS